MLLLGLQYIPSPSMGQGEGGGEGQRSACASLLSHPNLGATASAQGPLGPFPRQGGRSKTFLWHAKEGRVTVCRGRRMNVVSLSSGLQGEHQWKHSVSICLLAVCIVLDA
jgi:hypothetical protein